MWLAFSTLICKRCAMEPIEQQDKETSDNLTISAEKAFFIIVKAREFDEKVAASDPEFGIESPPMIRRWTSWRLVAMPRCRNSKRR